jgi:lipopolysaccharide biosynthesis glycosyltransferase
MKKVFVIVSDYNYLEHAKYLFYSAVNQGKWTGDLCLIANNVEDNLLNDFRKFGVHILPIKEDNVYYATFYIFDEFFKKWDFLTYMDSDFTIFGDLNTIVEQSDCEKPILHVEEEPFRLHQYFCQSFPESEKNNLLSNLRQSYDLDKFGFNAGHISFNTSLIEKNTLSDLFEMCHNLSNINNHSGIGSDQPIINLYFTNNHKMIENKKVSFWRGSDENTIAQHHLHIEAPWNCNDFSYRLNKTYLENYLENLNNFYELIKNK